jgi:hypothetical protein
MGTSRAAFASALVATVLVAGCGGAASRSHPAGWRTATIASGASIAVPPAWKRIRGDRGTASAAMFGPGGVLLGYLNLTPRQGDETLANWGRFRVEHNAEEGQRHVTTLSAYRSGQRACVKDSYTTRTDARYVELACLVEGADGAVVAVGASPPGAWPRLAQQIERAIASVRT